METGRASSTAVPPLQKDWMSRVANVLATPLASEGYLEMFNPLWSSQLRGKVESVQRHGDRAISLTLRTNRHWQGHHAGQYVQLGVDVEGVRQWRCYSVTSADTTPGESRISLTIGHLPGGKVSGWLMRHARVGMTLALKPAMGEFVLPDSNRNALLLVSAGTGITPMIAMLRQLARQADAGSTHTPPPVTVLHYAPDYSRALFIDELNALEARFPWLTVYFSLTRGQPVSDDLSGHFSPAQLAQVCPDWTQRTVFVCGPEALMDNLAVAHLEQRAEGALYREAFSPALKVNEGSHGGGHVQFYRADKQVAADGNTSLLEVAEHAGLLPEHGCRMGICQCCITTLKAGQVRDMRTGEVFGEAGDAIKICVCAAAGSVQLDL